MKPALLLADEPTGNLDSKSAADVLSLLDKVHVQGRWKTRSTASCCAWPIGRPGDGARVLGQVLDQRRAGVDDYSWWSRSSSSAERAHLLHRDGIDRRRQPAGASAS
nr:hypothetical protein [Frateuria soli]